MDIYFYQDGFNEAREIDVLILSIWQRLNTSTHSSIGMNVNFITGKANFWNTLISNK